MTWYYDIAADNSSMDVYDHTGTKVTTLTNDGSGFTTPDDILSVMESEAQPELPDQAASVTARGAEILVEMSREDIQKGKP